jgi:hypothetical protein
MAGREGYLGAILVTDEQGVPLEFRCTHPVKPTAIQRRLYGDTLEPHVGVILCGVPLAKSLQHKPSLLLVPQEFLLGVRNEVPWPTAYLRRAGKAIDISVPGDATGTLQRQRIDCVTGRFQPIVLSTHPEHPEDNPLAAKILGEVFKTLDPLEPFERISKALDALGQQEPRFR